jgi:hypothetical protein
MLWGVWLGVCRGQCVGERCRRRCEREREVCMVWRFLEGWVKGWDGWRGCVSRSLAVRTTRNCFFFLLQKYLFARGAAVVW